MRDSQELQLGCNDNKMDQLCTSCSQKLGPLSNVLPHATASHYATRNSPASLEAFELQSCHRALETEKTAYQAPRTPQNIDEFQSTGEWPNFPTPADAWFTSAQFPTNSFISGYDGFDEKECCLDAPQRPRIGSIDTSEPSPLAANRPDRSTNSDYRCYRHGCEGRRFSSSENYRRHIRERSQSDKTSCPFCAAVFTRKSNKDTHIRKGRCKALNSLSCGRGNTWANDEGLPEGFYDGVHVEQF